MDSNNTRVEQTGDPAKEKSAVARVGELVKELKGNKVEQGQTPPPTTQEKMGQWLGKDKAEAPDPNPECTDGKQSVKQKMKNVWDAAVGKGETTTAHDAGKRGPEEQAEGEREERERQQTQVNDGVKAPGLWTRSVEEVEAMSSKLKPQK